VFLFAVMGLNLSAQSDPCIICKKNVEFQVPGTECKVIFDYCFFVDDFGYHNLKIGNYRYSCNPEGFAMPMSEIIDSITAFLYSNPSLYTPSACWPPIPSCESGEPYLCNIKLSSGVCYKESKFNEKTGMWEYIPCDNKIKEVSCYSVIRMCWERVKDEKTGKMVQRLKIEKSGVQVDPDCPCKNTCW
jgi:hypothetical protein